jgi:acyl-CoA reductase-like NAD-dependent aldehyde dehydrogenase
VVCVWRFHNKYAGVISVLTFAGVNPTTGEPIARVKAATKEDYERILTKMTAAQKDWQNVRSRESAHI